jgi:hypothetical protein
MKLPVTRHLLCLYDKDRNGASALPSLQPVHGLLFFRAVGALDEICRFTENRTHGLMV